MGMKAKLADADHALSNAEERYRNMVAQFDDEVAKMRAQIGSTQKELSNTISRLINSREVVLRGKRGAAGLLSADAYASLIADLEEIRDALHGEEGTPDLEASGDSSAPNADAQAHDHQSSLLTGFVEEIAKMIIPRVSVTMVEPGTYKVAD